MSDRYALQPLLTAMRATLSQAQQELGVGGGQICRYRDQGMKRESAELLATRAGFHVYEVWPEMVEQDGGVKECAAPDCPVTFIPPTPRPGQKHRHYCSRTCQQRTNARNLYQSNEVSRERRKASSRRYKQEVRALADRRSGRLLARLELEQIHPDDRWIQTAGSSSDRDVSQLVPRAHLTKPWESTRQEESP